MSFLNNTELAQLLPSCISPFLPERLTSGAYELAMGNEFFTTNSDKKVKVKLKAAEQFVIRPGQFALLVTKETIRIPETNLGFISIKAGVKFRGLINVSGFHVDPGFHGKLKFSVYNAGSRDILLTEGQRLFPLWLGEFTSALPASELYSGHFQNQDGITTDDISRIEGKLFSPNALSERIKELDSSLATLKIYGTIITTLFIGIFIKYVLTDIDNTKWQQLAQEQAGYNARLARIDSLLTRTRVPLPAMSKAAADTSRLPTRPRPPRR